MKLKSILLFIFLIVVCPAWADIFTVSDIPVSAEAETTTAARAVALQQGQIEAFDILMGRMLSSDNQEHLPFVDTSEINNFVKTISVANEKITATKYTANLSIQFKSEAIKDFFTENRIPFITETMPTVLLIPVYKDGSEIQILEEVNPFFQALKQESLSGKVMTGILPVGDLEEITMAQEAYRKSNWTEMLRKYNASYALIMLLDNEADMMRFKVQFIPEIYRSPFVYVGNVALDGKDISDIWSLIAPNLLEQIESKWLEENSNDLSQPFTYWIQISVDNLSVWRQMEKKLKTAPFIDNLMIRHFRQKEVVITIQYQGDENKLNAEFNKIGFELRPSGNDNLLVLWPYKQEIQR